MAALPIYNTVAVPDADIYFKTDYYTEMTGRTPGRDDRIFLIVMKDKQAREELTGDSFYPIGLSGQITEVSAEGYICVRTRNRVNIDDVVVYNDHSIDLSISRRPDLDDLDRETAGEHLKQMKSAVIRFSDNYQWGPAIRGYIAQWTNMGEIAAAMSPWLMNTNEERYALLAEDSLARRNDMMEQMLYENLEMTTIKNDAKAAQEESYQKMYKESAIRKQIEYLQKQLDEMHPENVSDLRRLEIKVEESGMNETARKEADKVLNRLRQEGSNGTETGMLYDYLDFLTGLSWKKEKPQNIDLGEAERILEEDHFGLEKVRKRIIQQIAVMNLRRQQSGSILLFVGAPGTGKTSIGQSIARALQRKYVRVSLGGVRDEADIRGHRRTYIGAMPGRIMDSIQKSGASNPVMVLDEVDKLGISYNGDPASALLEVLDPEQNSTFTDHYMNVPYDLSNVFFICTANSVDTIPEPLLNRMEVIQFQGYTPLDKMQIAKKHLLPKAMRAVGIREENLEMDDSVLETIISEYTRESGVRGLKKRMDTLCRSAAVELVRGSAGKITVTRDNLRDYMDARPIHHGKVKEKARTGVVTGLAWTAVGGEILYIETLLTKGSGKITVTGQLGDVMKESAQIAVSLVRSLFPEAADRFRENDLHIHVPDGATPKDGPSAGITMTTALSSLITGIPVRPDTAMTGEISLQGDVKPIGGLPEKLMAAQRAGVRRVFIPAENLEDLRDVAAEVRDSLEIIPVERAEEVLTQLGIMERPAAQDAKQAG